MAMNKILVFTGVVTLFQALGQLVVSGLGIAQYFCLVDFLKQLPLLLYIRILYLHNPNTCGVRISIGQTIDGVSNQAFVFVPQEPTTVFRTVIFNSVSLILSLLWLTVGITVMNAGVQHTRPTYTASSWIVVTALIIILDIVTTVTYANDSFYTRTLSDMLSYIGATPSGMGNVELDTSLASWTMVILSSRFVILFFVNVILVVMVIIDSSRRRKADDTESLVLAVNPFFESTSKDLLSVSSDNVDDLHRIPRPGLSKSFRQMKMAFEKSSSFQTNPKDPLPKMSDSSSDRSAKVEPAEDNKKRAVNFPENLLSLPQKLENLIAQQQRRLDSAVIDTAGRSQTRASRSMSQLETAAYVTPPANMRTERRATAATLSQLPWAYIGSVNRMRDQLPPEEELPPIPLPDYSVMPSFRRTSVHRGASSLSSLTQKKEGMHNKTLLSKPAQTDFWY